MDEVGCMYACMYMCMLPTIVYGVKARGVSVRVEGG